MVAPTVVSTAPLGAPMSSQDDSTPVRDEVEDGVERCATPVLDETGDDGGSTPVRDEWD